MALLLKQIFAFFKLLNSDTGTTSIAAGVALGFVLGMSPALSLQGLLVFTLMFFFRVQIGAAFLAAGFFAFAAWLLHPIFDALGSLVLGAEALAPLWTTLYNIPLLPLTRFNDTVVMGAGILALALTPVVFLASRALIGAYREQIVRRLRETRAFRLFALTSFYKWYVKYDELLG
jgi:uncharacterized protein (TIGR03546 family)